MNKVYLNVFISEDNTLSSVKNLKLLNKKEISNIINVIFDVIEKSLNLYCKFKNINFSLRYISDSEIQKINLQYRNKDKATNTLSFQFLKFDKIFNKKLIKKQHNIKNNISIVNKVPCYLGDIIISLETILKESIEENITFDYHLKHIFIHSFLHLLSFDHIKNKDYEIMNQIEMIVLEKIFNKPIIK